jgi:hypothetical protein
MQQAEDENGEDDQADHYIEAVSLYREADSSEDDPGDGCRDQQKDAELDDCRRVTCHQQVKQVDGMAEGHGLAGEGTVVLHYACIGAEIKKTADENHCGGEEDASLQETPHHVLDAVIESA